ncbi:MAG: polysaccharide deacetylase family protein [Candidatus Hodarchaeales archaeon]|jgi:peptidoglycan/xylan/chitin deacetylase (PgdA/CDA1 family)
MEKYLKNKINYWNIYSLEYEYNTNIGETHPDVLKEPIVSSFLIQNGYNPEYPEGKSFAICLTHDIDEIYIPMIHRAHSILSTFTSTKTDNLRDAFRGILNKKKSNYLDFREIMALEEKFDSRSTFFFLTAKKDPQRFRYDIEDITNELGSMKDRGFEIGLHGGFFSYDDFEALREEKRRLERSAGIDIEGYRSHYLNLHIPRTWQHLTKLGFKYDSTLGFRKGSGFRNGMCHPFYPYIKEIDKELNLLEIPLIIMDASYPTLGFTVSKFWEEILYIIDLVERNHGVLTINWHNDSLLSTRKSEHRKMYEKILTEGKKRGAWLSNCHDIYAWWIANSKKFEIRCQ